MRYKFPKWKGSDLGAALIFTIGAPLLIFTIIFFMAFMVIFAPFAWLVAIMMYVGTPALVMIAMLGLLCFLYGGF